MCTVTAVPHAHGVRLVANRDERRTRPSALPPSQVRLGSCVATFPVDPVAGGSWVGANDHGVAVALLNRHVPGLVHPGGRALLSRGLIVPLLLGCPDLGRLLATAWTIDRRCFAPFRLLAIQHRCAVLLSAGPMDWRIRQVSLDRPLMLTSSSLGDAVVDPPRRRLFERLMRQSGSWLEAQHAFHAHRCQTDPAVSIVMTRPDARTVSRTWVDLEPHDICLAYEPLALACDTSRDDDGEAAA